MRNIVLVVLAVLFFNASVAENKVIQIKNNGCRYKLTVLPEWDTIPKDTLREKLPQLNLDLGIYLKNQKDYFNKTYFLIGFAPSLKTLDNFSFAEISKDIENMFVKKGNVKNNMASNVKIDSIVPSFNEKKYWINCYLGIRKDSTVLKSCQTYIVSKFGYIVLMGYTKDNKVSFKNMVQQELVENINVDSEYQYDYVRPNKISYLHILFSIGIGIIVYFLIVFFSKRNSRQKL